MFTNQTNHKSAVGTNTIGQAVTFLFPISETSDIVVKSVVTLTGVETLLAITTNYTVVIAADDGGGTVTMVTAVAATSTIHITRATPMTQELDLVAGGSFNPENIEDSLDKVTKMAIDNKKALDFCLRLPDTDSESAELSAFATRAGKFLYFGAGDGDPTVAESVTTGETTISAFAETVIDDADATAMLATLGLTVSDFGKTVIDDADADAVQATLHLQDYTDTLKLADIELKGPYADVRAYGAVGNGVADDTVAIQAALDAASPTATAVFFPPGTYMVSNLLLPAPCVIQGSSLKFPVLKMIAGSVGNMIEDDGNAQGVSLSNLQIHGNDNNANGVVLGFNTYAHGGGAYLENLLIRNFDLYALKVNGNAAIYRHLEFWGAAGAENKVYITGTANTFSQIVNSSRADYGIEVYGTGNLFYGTHFEGDYTSAAILIDGDNNQFIGVTGTVDATVTLPAAFEILTGEYCNVIHGLSVYLEAGGVATAMIIDDSHGSRIVQGRQGLNSNYLMVDHYYCGRERNQVPQGLFGPPLAGTWRLGDSGHYRETVLGVPASFYCVASGAPGTWVPAGTLPGAIAKTADYTIVVTTDNGKRFSNAGDTGTIVFTLPAATLGQTYHFIRLATQSLRVDPDGTETIRGGAAGEYLQLDADGDNVTLQCIVTGSWEIISQKGTPSFA